MEQEIKTKQQLFDEIEGLRTRLKEAEETLIAVRNGEVDAIIVSGKQGEQVFTLPGVEKVFRVLIETMNEGAASLNQEGLIIYCNQRFAEMIKTPLEKAIGAPLRRFILPSDLPLFDSLMDKGSQENRKGEVALANSDGTALPALLSISSLQKDDADIRNIIVTDLTEQKHVEEELRRHRDNLEERVRDRTDELETSNQQLLQEIAGRKEKERDLQKLARILLARSKSSKAMMSARNEDWYLNEVCRIIVEDCGHALVWIGFAEQDDGRTVRPVAHAGLEEDYLDVLNITWSDTERGRGPVGIAIRTGKHFVFRNIIGNPVIGPCCEDAVKRGYSAVIGVPLLADGKAFGSLNIYSRQEDPFSDDEVQLLSDLASDLSFGIAAIRQRTAQAEAEISLRESKARLQTLVQTIPDLVWLKDINGVYLACNPTFEHFFGAREADILGKTDYDFVGRELADFFRMHDRKAMEAGKPSSNEEWLTFANDGHRALMETIKTPMYDAAGKVIGVLGIARDITDRTRAEAALRESETQYRSLFENMLEGFAYCKLILAQGKVQDFVHLQVNGAFERLTGLRDVVGKKVSEVIPGMRETNPELFEIFGRVAATGTSERVEAFSEAFGGWLSISVYSTEKEHFVAVFDNITERKKAEEELRFNNAVLAAQQETAIDGILLVDGEGKILNYNTRFVDMWGLVAEAVATGRDEKVLQTVLDEVKHPEKFLKKVKHLYEAPEEKSRDEIALRDGRTFDRYSAPMSSSDGKYYGRIWYFRDITERKQAEEALRESQQVLEGIINAIPVRVFWKDRNLVYLGCNAVFARDAGFDDPKDIIGKDDYQMGWRDLAEVYRSDDRRVIESGGSKLLFEEPLTTPEGDTITLLTSKIPLLSSHGEIIGVIGTYLDITERKHAEQALFSAEKKFKDLLETINLISIMLDRNGNITFCNDYLLHLTGWTRDEVLKGNWFDLFLPDAIREAVRSMFTSNIAEGVIPAHYENLIITRDGNKKNIVWDNSILRDVEEKIIGLASIGTDVTEHQRLEAQYLQAQKMESIGTLAGGVAHDFNNILSAIIGYGHVTLMKMANDDPLRANIEHMLEAADRAARLTKELLLFSRKHLSERKPVDVNEVVRTVEKFLIMVIGEDIACKTMLREQSLPVYADSHQLEQVLMNLATNARDAMPRGGALTIKTEQIDLTENFAKAHGYGKSGPYAMMTISDTGAGMDEATQKHIFDPFFTTKEVGKGTGLGLAVVYGIIKDHEGFINVYSEPGRGTTFRIYLPIIATEADEKTVPRLEDAPARGTETVLLAEDDVNLRKLSRTVLAEFGYTVIEAVDGAEAVKKFMENKDTIRLLLFDLVMPKMNGKEAADEIRKIKPDMKVLFASGYDPDLLQQKELLGEGVHLVYKPISPMDLLRKVRSVLDGVK